jgi:hypothetical protein
MTLKRELKDANRTASPAVTALSNRAILVTGLGMLLFSTACLVTLPILFRQGGQEELVRLEAIRVASTLAVGAGGIIALWLAARRQRSTELELARQYDADRASELDAIERRITDLYTKAADQLGSEKAPVRLAGLYALERVGSGAPSQRATIVSVVCAYLRMPVPPGGEPGDAPTADSEWAQEHQVRLTAQRILKRRISTVVGRLDHDSERWPGVAVDLTSAELSGADFARTDLSDAVFARASLMGADCSGALGDHADFRQANLAGASLASFRADGADLSDAVLTDADLSAALLRNADLSRAALDGADLRGCDLSGATLQGASLDGIRFDERTRWPTAEIGRRVTMARADGATSDRRNRRPGSDDES